MPQGDRFTVSLDTELLAAFDTHLAGRGYENRSEAIRDLIRDRLLEPQLGAAGAELLATIAVACDQRVAKARQALRKTLLEAGRTIVSAQWHAIDAETDLIAISLRGPTSDVQRVVDRLQAIRGLHHGRVSAIPASPSPPAAGTSPP